MRVIRAVIQIAVVALLTPTSMLAPAKVPSYGPGINLEQARKVIAAGQAEAKKNNCPLSISVGGKIIGSPFLRFQRWAWWSVSGFRRAPEARRRLRTVNRARGQTCAHRLG